MKEIIQVLQDFSVQDPTSDSYEQRIIRDNDFEQIADIVCNKSGLKELLSWINERQKQTTDDELPTCDITAKIVSLLNEQNEKNPNIPIGLAIKGTHGAMLINTGEVAAKTITVAFSPQQRKVINELYEQGYDIIQFTPHH